MIKSVVREHHWPPSVIGGLFLDEGIDGLIFWFNDVKEVSDSLTKKTEKK